MRTVLLLILVAPASPSTLAAEPPFGRLWVLAECNFQLDEDTGRFISLLRRAKAAGYTGVVFHEVLPVATT